MKWLQCAVAVWNNNKTVQVTTTFICWRLTHVNDCMLTWPTLKETAHMLSTTISRWPQLRTNTDSFLLEHTMEPQVGTVMENFGRKCFKLWSEMSCLSCSANQQTTRYDWREMSYNLRSARPKFRPRGLDRMASFYISGFRAIKTGSVGIYKAWVDFDRFICYTIWYEMLF